LVAAALVISVNLWTASYNSPQIAALDAAQQRWDRRSFSHYRLTIEREQMVHKCQQSLEIRNEKIVAVLEDVCHTDPLSVSGLFTLLRNDLTPSICDDEACLCRTLYQISPTYDESLGYPTVTLLVPIKLSAVATDAESWGQAPGMNRQLKCLPGNATMYETITVRDLTPLP
jgi:Family of unknown function (DUF6174)